MIRTTKEIRTVSPLPVVAGMAALQLLAGCMTLERIAPPVKGELQIVAARHNVNTTTLELGREIYLSDCARCHGVEPIGRYSANAWRDILARMNTTSMLDAEESEAVVAYVTLARALLTEKATSSANLPQEHTGGTLTGDAGH